jgi:hypothetical protein
MDFCKITKELAEKNIFLLYSWCSKNKHVYNGDYQTFLADMSLKYMIAINTFLKKPPEKKVKLTTWIINHLEWEKWYIYQGRRKPSKSEPPKFQRMDFQEIPKKLQRSFSKFFDLDKKIDQDELIQQVKKEINNLPEKQREAIIYYHFHDLNFYQIARIKKVTHQCIHFNYLAGIKNLRKKFESVAV